MLIDILLPNNEYCFNFLILKRGVMIKSLKKSSKLLILGSILNRIQSNLNSFSNIVKTFGTSIFFEEILY